jgi:transposase
MRPFAEDVTEELEIVPAKLFVREHVRPKYSCASCAEGVVQASLPARPIEKGRPGPGLLAHIVVSKFVDHLPLYRQAGIFARHGIDLPRSTLCDYVAACAEELDPVVRELARTVRASRIVQADETRLLVLEQHDGKRRRECWLWVYRASSGETVFDFRETRSRDGPREFLRGFQGHLQCDGYQGYGDLGPGVVIVGCWAHARRKFFEAQTSAAADSKAALALFGKLYAIEADARQLDPEARAALRREKARPVLLEIEARLEEWSMSALPKSEFGQAVAYARSQWPKLVRYLDDGGLEIDNNLVEGTIRGVAVGRKNYLFAGSYEGARRAATIYSLVESCKSAGVEPYAYFADALARTTTATPRELIPSAWKAAREAEAAVGAR